MRPLCVDGNPDRAEQLGCKFGTKRYKDMAKPDAATVAKTLRELAQRMELEGGNPYRARAYARAAENLSLSPEPLDRLIKEGRLTEIPGIGDAIAAVITKIYQTGQHAGLDAMREKFPEGVLAMLRIPGLQARPRAQALHRPRHCLGRGTRGSRPQRQAQIAQRLRPRLSGEDPAGHRDEPPPAGASYPPRRRRHRLRHKPKSNGCIPDWQQITPAGEFRRGCELVGALSLVAVDPKLRGKDKRSSKATSSRSMSPAASAMASRSCSRPDQTSTSKRLRARAAKRGCTLDETGLHKKNSSSRQQNRRGHL